MRDQLKASGYMMDKAYCTQAAKHGAVRKQCHVAVIKKNNMKGKNKDLDRWYSSKIL